MLPDPTKFDLPHDILEKLRDPNSGVRAEVKPFLFPLPPEYEVTITNSQSLVIYKCARPCPTRLGV